MFLADALPHTYLGLFLNSVPEEHLIDKCPELFEIDATTNDIYVPTVPCEKVIDGHKYAIKNNVVQVYRFDTQNLLVKHLIRNPPLKLLLEVSRMQENLYYYSSVTYILDAILDIVENNVGNKFLYSRLVGYPLLESPYLSDNRAFWRHQLMNKVVHQKHIIKRVYYDTIVSA